MPLRLREVGTPTSSHEFLEALVTDWIRQCQRAGLYEQGRVLYVKGGFTFDSLGEEAQVDVEEDYQICVRRT